MHFYWHTLYELKSIYSNINEICNERNELSHTTHDAYCEHPGSIILVLPMQLREQSSNEYMYEDKIRMPLAVWL